MTDLLSFLQTPLLVRDAAVASGECELCQRSYSAGDCIIACHPWLDDEQMLDPEVAAIICTVCADRSHPPHA